LLLAEGFEEVEALTTVDFLRRAQLDVRIVGIGDGVIEGSHGISVVPDMSIDQLTGEVEGVIVPGGMPGAENVASSDKALELIRRADERGRLVAAICAAPAVVLEKAGVLRGRGATCYPGFENRFTDVDFRQDRVVVDGNLVTSRGPGTAAEFSMALIEILAGKKAADEIASATLQPMA
jgi:4-methyl-5(b-hydroxyethyl)-thiazole monophosphate biosynthesis